MNCQIGYPTRGFEAPFAGGLFFDSSVKVVWLQSCYLVREQTPIGVDEYYSLVYFIKILEVGKEERCHI